jgi:DNA polymerase-3 subunit beta
MQFEVQKSLLQKAISDVYGAVEKKNTISILQNIKIDAKNNKIELYATDMDILVNSHFECEITQEGSTTVPANMFFEIIRKISDGKIAIDQTSENQLRIKTGKSVYNLPCIDASEFPNLSEGDLGDETEVDSQKLCRMIDKTRFAISNDESRYYLNGLFLQAVSNDQIKEIRSVATDGHRLAIASINIDHQQNFGVIIPKKSVNEIRRIIDGCKSVKIQVSRVKIKVSTESSVIISKLIDGEFPDYEKVLPKNNPHAIKLNKKQFYDSIDRVSTLANDKHRSIKIVIETNKINLQVSTNEGSFAHEEIDIDYANDKIETGFNSRYLLEVINQVDKDELTMYYKDGFSPALVEAVDLGAKFVIMPIRI